MELVPPPQEYDEIEAALQEAYEAGIQDGYQAALNEGTHTYNSIRDRILKNGSVHDSGKLGLKRHQLLQNLRNEKLSLIKKHNPNLNPMFIPQAAKDLGHVRRNYYK